MATGADDVRRPIRAAARERDNVIFRKVFAHRFATPITAAFLRCILALHIGVIMMAYGGIQKIAAAAVSGSCLSCKFFGMVFLPLARALSGLSLLFRRILVISISLRIATRLACGIQTMMAATITREVLGSLRQNLLAGLAALHAIGQALMVDTRRKTVLETTANLAFSRYALRAARMSIELRQRFEFATNLTTFGRGFNQTFSFAGFAIAGVDGAAKQAFRADDQSVLVHMQYCTSGGAI